MVDLAEVERRMRPGGWYSRPLLRAGARLGETIDGDAAALRQLGQRPTAWARGWRR